MAQRSLNVAAGEEVVIARGDKPAVRLVPAETPRPKRAVGTLEGKLEVRDSFSGRLPEDELRLWESG